MVSDRAVDAAVAAFVASGRSLYCSASPWVCNQVRKMLEAAAAAIDVLDLRERMARSIYAAMAAQFDDESRPFDDLDNDERAIMFALADAALGETMKPAEESGLSVESV